MDAKAHWTKVYAEKAPEQVSWHQGHLERSLEIIARVAGPEARVLDVGGGASTLAEDLLARGFTQVTVLDIAEMALERSRERMGAAAAERVRWIAGDVRSVALPAAEFDVWHDRAVFHFLTKAADRAAYVRQAAHAVSAGGHVMVSTFGPAGPARCSGLEVVRYDAAGLAAEFGAGFRLVESGREVHRTPWGAEQAFTVCVMQSPVPGC